MAALEGLAMELNGDDVVVTHGLYNEVAVAGITFDLSVLTPTNGTVYVVLDGTTLSLSENVVAGTEVLIGAFTSATNVASDITSAGRGDTVAVSADDSITL